MRTLLAFLIGVLAGAAEQPYLYQQPTVNKTHVVFVFAGDLWTVPRSGGQAVRLTAGKGVESYPFFSPDGTQVAFTGEYDGNVDVFVVPAAGGVPKRLTAHPAVDRVCGWSPDGKRVLFSSNRESFSSSPKLFAVSVEGGLPEALPFPMAFFGAYSPDGTRIAYMPLARADMIWKRYRGGRTTPIWIGRLSDSEVTAIPRDNSNDYNPMWIGDAIYFLSDREGKVTLFRYDLRSRQVKRAIDNRGFDLKWASAGPDVIAYEQFGSIYLYDLKTGASRPVAISIAGDLPELRPRMEKIRQRIEAAAISPSGARAVFEARGEILTVPAEKGDARNITRSPGVADRDPAWSPDGKWIAYFSDESGEYTLHISPQSGLGETRKIALDKPPSFYYEPRWSPDSKKIAYTDKRLQLWYIDLDKGAPVLVDRGTYYGSHRLMDPVWSPDSKWIAYAKQQRNRQCVIMLYALESGRSTPITDGMSDARYPVFDKSGKYLFLAASTNAGPTMVGLDMSSRDRPVTRTVYAVVLRKEDPSPVAPESDEEKSGEEKKPASGKAEEKKTEGAQTVRIDFEGISQRIVPLPIPARNYVSLQAGKEGILFLLEEPVIPGFVEGPSAQLLHRFDLAKRKGEKFAEGVSSFWVSHNGEKILLRQGENFAIVPTASLPKPGDGRLKLDEVEIRVDPPAEWRQMYREVLRIERDFFYDPNHHGLDLQALGERFAKYLPNLASRTDLDYLWQEMLGELSVGHLYIRGGDRPEPEKVKGGLLGADYRIENGRYRIARIYSGENWNPQTRAPLTQPDVNVNVGDYILAVNGKELTAADEIYAAFEGTAGKSVVLRVGPDPSGAGAREVTVVPIDDEFGLRRLAWIEDNRRKVDQMSGGKVAYVYLPDTASGGYTYFNRYYYAQADRQAVVIDERFNGGGQAADYIIDQLRRPLWNFWASREGEDSTTPGTAIFGPKVMIVNEYAGSGGDLLPWLFRRAGLGPIIGKRTWGGLVGIGGYPTLIDGGRVTAPHFAFYTPEGNWEVENRGTPVDIEVELDPKAWRQGRDTQLERAVAVVMELLKKNPPPMPRRPPYPNYHTRTGATSAGVQ